MDPIRKEKKIRPMNCSTIEKKILFGCLSDIISVANGSNNLKDPIKCKDIL